MRGFLNGSGLKEKGGRETNPNNRRSPGPRNHSSEIDFKYGGDKGSYIFQQFDLIISISPDKSWK